MMRQRQTIYSVSILLVCSLALGACGKPGSNVADCEDGQAGVPCSELTPDEKAQAAMRDGEFTTAIDLLTELIADDPENFDRHPLLSSAYAARAGFDIFAATKTSFGGGKSLIETLGDFLPSPADLGPEAYDESLVDMDSALTTLQSIPADLLADSEDAYAASAILQTTLYGSAYSIMYLNKFAIGTDGNFDPTQLATMTQADALIILNSLAAAAGTQSGEQSEALQSQISEALTTIDGQDGATDRDKLIAYTQAQH